MPDLSVGLGAIGQIAMPVRDPERATAFYRDTLRLPFLFAAPPLAFFDRAGVRLMLTVPESPEFEHPGSILYFRVPDIASAHVELSGRGVAFRDAPHLVARLPDHELWLAFFDDTEGNTLALMGEIPLGRSTP
jgi:catechol 2,3-dioxygenase-like lactoylglutathione lyase family enzyme